MRELLVGSLLCGLMVMVGCNYLDQNPKAVKSAVAELERDLNGTASKDVAKHLASDFAWEDASNRKHGASSWARRMLQLKGSGNVTFAVDTVRKIGADSYLALIDVTSTGGSWRLSQTWEKQDESWKLANVHDLSAPSGGTPPAAPPKSIPEQIVEDTGRTVDYATGSTPLTQKRQLKDRIKAAETKQNERTRRTLNE